MRARGIGRGGDRVEDQDDPSLDGRAAPSAPNERDDKHDDQEQEEQDEQETSAATSPSRRDQASDARTCIAKPAARNTC
jgi:hypothetical protein